MGQVAETLDDTLTHPKFPKTGGFTMRIFTTIALSLALVTTASMAAATMAPGDTTTIPVHANGELTFTSETFDPITGFVTLTGDIVNKGSQGKVTGSDTYVINPFTGGYAGSGFRQHADGSTYDVDFAGQFISATDSIGTYMTYGGTGHFEGQTGSGTFSTSRWDNGLGSSSIVVGTLTIQH